MNPLPSAASGPRGRDPHRAEKASDRSHVAGERQTSASAGRRQLLSAAQKITKCRRVRFYTCVGSGVRLAACHLGELAVDDANDERVVVEPDLVAGGPPGARTWLEEGTQG